jgi:RNA polymerase sigma-70 factor (ECF subfamily)
MTAVREVEDHTEAWDELVRTHRPAVYRRALQLTRDPFQAEDLTQDAFVRAFRAYHRFRPDAPAAWLKQIVTNLFLDSVRRRRRITFQPLTEADDPVDRRSAEQLVLDAQLEPALARALTDLPDGMRDVLLMRYVHDRSDEEIAAALGVEVATVRTRSHRARARLRAALHPSTAQPRKARS